MARVLLLHGLPEGAGDPLGQLAAVEAVCQANQIDTQGYRWAGDQGEEARTVIQSLRRATFFSTYLPRVVANGILPFLASLAPTEQGSVVAYSAGVSLFYAWAASLAQADATAQAALSRIKSVIAIAGPHRWPRRVFLEHRPGKPIPVNERALDKHAIASLMTDHRIELKVILGGNDITIPPVYGSFFVPPRETGEPAGGSATAPSLPNYPYVEELILGGATHLSIRSEQRLLDKLPLFL